MRKKTPSAKGHFFFENKHRPHTLLYVFLYAESRSLSFFPQDSSSTSLVPPKKSPALTGTPAPQALTPLSQRSGVPISVNYSSLTPSVVPTSSLSSSSSATVKKTESKVHSYQDVLHLRDASINKGMFSP